ncbi:DUF6090 family protein [[Muricauda] lutisoli]|uniref:Uncharacterized protein n=1 Tax=[Muricauda] lutisoli TaxID=2816035 RepID=A0ABS3F048_9FLAO|nr:DUF6090 family protein [[Muricauda] lutisoli]MBO0331893.1 hypothetical protein [[Muricauda] lutisoli]
MINFFRKIRQNLLSEGKTGKYLKYAIGEIILVVIGILIALQINNWNEGRKDRIKEQVILKQLQEDYQANLVQLEQKIETREKVLTSAFRLLRAFDNPVGIVRDSVIQDLAMVRNDPTFDPIQNDLISSENLRLIRNGKLKHLLSNWSSDVVGVTEIEVVWTKVVNEQFDPIISDLGLGRDIYNSFINDIDHYWLLDKNINAYKEEIGTSSLGATLNEILTSKKLESMISISIANNKGANLQSEALRLRILEILNLLRDGIEK